MSSQRQRQRQLRRRQVVAVTALGAVIAVVVLFVVSLISPARIRHGVYHPPPHSRGHTVKTRAHQPGSRAGRAVSAGTYGVGVVTLHLVDRTRTVTLPGGQVVPRPVTTVVDYPTPRIGASGDIAGAQPTHADGPFPLIIFGHGFDILPSVYGRLLRYWTSAGFVVAAPIFPLENSQAPGGPDENDLPNQPNDMRFVISSLLHLDAQRNGPLKGLIDTHQIAVAGQSDGGDTALALAYDPSRRDSHLQAAVILSGAEIPMLPAFKIPAGGPPLLATQGTADDINLPSATAAYFNPAPPPKYLLQLLGGSHLGPYSTDRTQLRVVERVTTAFLQYYLDSDRAAMHDMLSAGHVSGVARLQADP